MDVRTTKLKLALGAGCALAVLAAAATAQAEERTFNLASSRATDSIPEFARQAGLQIVAPAEKLRGVSTPAIEGRYDTRAALQLLIAGTGLEIASDDGRTITLAQSPQSGSASDGAEGTVEALIVTAQKREEDIQDVPIAMSAFTQEQLTTHQIAGGPDLMTQIPNFTFTKTNFTSYSIQIRGIGTQAISATVDPAVAVAFNNTPFIRNRFFEQEFYDLQRIEVLRGPQGTLYGRNATAGVVNLITARPVDAFEAKVSADVANYNSTRLEGMVNLPLVEDKVALRIAGAWTKRDGYVKNGITGEQIDGRDLWSARATLGFEPTDSITAYLTYEHFEEDDDRLRSGKQLCTKHESPTEFGGFPIPDDMGSAFGITSYTSQGCIMGSLYDDEAFQTPNGFALPYYSAMSTAGVPVNTDIDPYVSQTQSKDLRVIESTLTPVYQAKTDLLHLALEFGLTDALTLTSETGYLADELFSFQDFNRFNTSPGIFDASKSSNPSGWTGVSRRLIDGVFCDPQLGCADRLVGADVSTARSRQFSQELRLSSDFDGPLNFHVGANYLRYDTIDKYYVFFNTLTMFASQGDTLWQPGITDNTHCLMDTRTIDPHVPDTRGGCMYIDPNPIGSLDDNGRQYFLSKNPFRLISYAAFGEVVYNVTPELKVTGGLRYTVDRKHAPMVPSWLLTNGYGLPVKEVIDQEWREPTGRLVVDWKPRLRFTDETLVYASYAHGYKAGGTNPPLPGALPYNTVFGGAEFIDALEELQPPEFGPEFVDAFEIGTKNTLLDGRLTVNGGAFYYDYEGYQISQIVNRSALNLNFDAEVWGAELEVDWRPLENLRFGFRGGYEKTRIGDGQGTIDMIDRTAGRTDWVVIKPFPTNPSNCVFPLAYLADLAQRGVIQNLAGGEGACNIAYVRGLDPMTGEPYQPNPPASQPRMEGYAGYDPSTAPNGGLGFVKDVGGNELPNAPDFTATITVDYTLPLPNDWLMTLHADFYRQSEAWTRIFNEDPYDRLEPFTQANLAAIFTHDDGWHVMAYVKNVFDADNITGAFLNSDDTGLTTNVFLNEPRLYGLRVTRKWQGGSLVGGWLGDGRPPAGGRYPWTVELGASATRIEADNQAYAPAFVDSYSAALRSILAGQDDDLDIGDGRLVKISYGPVGSAWTISASARFGRANGTSGAEAEEADAGGWIGPLGVEDPNNCEVTCYVTNPGRFARTRVTDREDYAVIDFTVGRDVGFGVLDRSRLGGGLRHVKWDSATQVEMDGISQYAFPPQFLILNSNATRVRLTNNEGRLESERGFEGTGPILSWEASKALFGSEEAGEVNLDWAVTAGVLFGKHDVRAVHEEDQGYYRFRWGALGPSSVSQRGPRLAPGSYHNPPAYVERSDDVTVPVFGGALGLSYSVGRVSVGAGYSYERYQEMLDGGVDAAARVDRNIHGPYFKLSLGFGG